ncbi:hypothetical protein ACL02R_17110 [Streptomyces sp. MS19]|uniref:hypothetical protein n=1 Tax=Streptomyces sp. MS19 TaxID=3385972 RepID=UPI0039A322FA
MSAYCLPQEAEAAAWAEVLLRHGLLHAAVATPNGQWLIQHTPSGPVRVLDGPAALLKVVSDIQRAAGRHSR